MKTRLLFVLTAFAMTISAVWAEDGTGEEVTPVVPKVYHVAIDGSDEAAGDEAAPFASIEKALELAVSGDEIIVGEGTYYLASTNGVTIPSGVTVTGDCKNPEKVVFTQREGLLDAAKTHDMARLFTLDNAVVRGVSLVGAYTVYKNSVWAGNNFQALALIMSNGSVVSNSIISDCHGPLYAPVVGMASGSMLTNCIVRNTKFSGSGGGATSIPINAVSSTIVDCVITNNQCREQPVVCMITSSLLNTTIADNERVYSYYGRIVAVKAEAASKIEDCIISNNVHKVADDGRGGPDDTATIYLSNSSIRRSAIVGNEVLRGTAGIKVYAQYAANVCNIENCLIIDNYSSSGIGGGIYEVAGKGTINVINCTIANNKCDTLSDGGDGYLKTGTEGALNIKGTIFWGNGNADINVVTAKTAVVSSIIPATSLLDAGKCTNRITDEPTFVNPEKGDYQLALGSVGIDAATEFDALATDLKGTARPQGTAADIGCYEFIPPPYACRVVAENTTSAGAETAIAAFVQPAEGVAKYKWTISKNGEVVETEETTTSAWSYTFGSGEYEIALTTEWSDGGSAEATWTILSLAPITYVSSSGSNEWPYDDASKAASSIQAAIDATADGGEVRLIAGTYGVAFADEGEYFVNIEKPIRLVGMGNGPRDTVIDCEASIMGVRIADGGVVITNLTIANSQSVGSGVARGHLLSAQGGIIDGCVTTGGRAKAGSNGECAVLLTYGATMRNSVVENCVRGDTAWTAQGPTLLARDSALIDNIVVSNNTWHGNGYGGTVSLIGDDVIMRDSLVIKNSMRHSYNNDYATAGVSLKSGAKLYSTKIIENSFTHVAAVCSAAGLVIETGDCLVDGCEVISNKVEHLGHDYVVSMAGVASKTGGIIKNTIIAYNSSNLGNSTKRTSAGGVIMTDDGANIQNCTIVGNSCVVTNNCGVYMSGGILRNCIVYGNGSITNGAGTASLMTKYGLNSDGYLAGDINYVGGTVGYSCFPVVVEGEGNVAGDPRFIAPEAGNYRLGPYSAARNKGNSEGFVRKVDKDLDGKIRVVGREIDMGCYEWQRAPTLMRLE